MTFAELLDYISANGIRMELTDGKLRFTPKEKIMPAAEFVTKYRELLAALASGQIRDWQGNRRAIRRECSEKHCPFCTDWHPYFTDEHEITGLCIARIKTELRIKDEGRKQG